MQAPGGDADLAAETEFAAIGELSRGVVQHNRAIDLAQEFLRRRSILGDDAIGMLRAVFADMGDRFIEPADNPNRKHRRQIFRAPILFRGFIHRRDRARRLIAA